MRHAFGRWHRIAGSWGINPKLLATSIDALYARGAATPRSDIDFHVIHDGSLRGLTKLAGFCRELEAGLALSVDILTNDALSDDFLE
ncbi:MAG: nucleotidyltransferase domain-containing protein [Coriobacteriales bacterium]|jgi:predicted nucleotidyltransferase|nr:nucleotidyltransferase domain-containing protein [Coriobacteriales bacterium]